jgi:hypothetical protein
MVKLNDFIKEKVNNFRNFVKEEMNKTEIPELFKQRVGADLDYFCTDNSVFITAVVQLAKFENPEDAIKHFMDNYSINIDEFKDKIDYEKLYRYIKMFIDIVKQ